MYEVQIHRARGADESFEADSYDDARLVAAREAASGDRVVIINEFGRVLAEFRVG